MSRVEPSELRVQITAAGETHIGGRAHNEDSVLLRPEHGLYAVADGAGEGGSGHVASGTAVSSVAAFFDESPPDWASHEPFDPLGLPRAAPRRFVERTGRFWCCSGPRSATGAWARRSSPRTSRAPSS
jgi:hypothetical protein